MGRSTHRPEYRAMVKRLKAARLAAGLTQVRAAEVLGTTQVFISRAERGQRRIDPIELAQFASLYGVSVNTLLPEVTVGSERKHRVEAVVDLNSEDYDRLLAAARQRGQSPESLVAEMVAQYAHGGDD